MNVITPKRATAMGDGRVCTPEGTKCRKIENDECDMHSCAPWTIDSWKNCNIQQNPFRKCDQKDVCEVERRLSSLPCIVNPKEIDLLLGLLSEVAIGKRFILHGGDCAELFSDCTPELIEIKMKILLQMSVVLAWAGKLPSLRIGRIAGQYAKPRSNDTEIVNGKEVMTFRGDCVNSIDPDDREPKPQKLVDAYFHSTATLNYVRSLLDNHFADLYHTRHWELDFVHSKQRRQEYEDMAKQIVNTLRFMETCKVGMSTETQKVDFFTSHEALILPYEAGLTHCVDGKYYDTSAHFVWIGDRTRGINDAHVEFCRGIANPIGLKVGPSSQPDEILNICKKLNPNNTPGKLTLITRFGASKVDEKLPKIIKAITDAGLFVVWQCDPMHGNTETTKTNIKTRKFDNICTELFSSMRIHRSAGTFLGGVHFEMTGEDVTECTGGPQELSENDLQIRYNTYCDPRLNYAQSMEIVFQIAKRLSDTDGHPVPASPKANHSKISNDIYNHAESLPDAAC